MFLCCLPSRFVIPVCHTTRKTEYNTTEQMTTPRKTTKKTTRLKRSKLENLCRHANGVYWVRAKVNRKSAERSLRTSDYNLAATLLPETLRELKGASEARNADTLAVAIQAEADREDPDLKPATRHYYQQIAKSIIDTLPPPIASKRLPQVTVGDLRAWLDIYAAKVGPDDSLSKGSGTDTQISYSPDEQAALIESSPFASSLNSFHKVFIKTAFLPAEDQIETVMEIAQKQFSGKIPLNFVGLYLLVLQPQFTAIRYRLARAVQPMGKKLADAFCWSDNQRGTLGEWRKAEILFKTNKLSLWPDRHSGRCVGIETGLQKRQWTKSALPCCICRYYTECCICRTNTACGSIILLRKQPGIPVKKSHPYKDTPNQTAHNAWQKQPQ